MPFSETKEGVITYQQGQKWSAVGPWLVNVISGVGIGLPGTRMGALLADAFNSKTAACWRTNARMAETLGTSVSSVIEGLRQLERNGHIVLIMEPRNGKLMRHIYPKANTGTARREVRGPHGGVPKGTQPKSHAITDAVSETRPLVHETKPPPLCRSPRHRLRTTIEYHPGYAEARPRTRTRRSSSSPLGASRS